MNEENNISKGTVIRTVLLIAALVNQVLLAIGKSPLPIESEQAQQLISLLFTGAASLIAWWKNNSFTKNAIAADEVLATLQQENSTNKG